MIFEVTSELSSATAANNPGRLREHTAMCEHAIDCGDNVVGGMIAVAGVYLEDYRPDEVCRYIVMSLDHDARGEIGIGDPCTQNRGAIYVRQAAQ
jgi:hypothetical protein